MTLVKVLSVDRDRNLIYACQSLQHLYQKDRDLHQESSHTLSNDNLIIFIFRQLYMHKSHHTQLNCDLYN